MDSRTRARWCLWVILLLSMIIPSHVSADDGAEPIVYESFPHLIPEINDFTGAARQQIPIAVPPGRNGIQPQLRFKYNSYAHNGLLGKGWQLEIGAIQRQTKWGVHYDQDEFVVISQGKKIELVPVGNDRYQPRIETDFTRYIFHRGDNYWEAVDKDGTRTYFGIGADTDARQSNPWGTFSWGLDRVEDSNGNYMIVNYYQDQGYRYPHQIDYTGNTNSGDAPSNKVIFSYDGEPRQDILPSYASKSLVKTALRLHSVKTYGVNNQLALEYRLKYEMSPVGGISLLKKIRIIGNDGQTEIQPYVFTYQPGASGPIVDGTRTESISMGQADRRFADVTGDNRDDLILLSSSSNTYITVYPSNANGTFDEGISSSFFGVPGNNLNSIERQDFHYFVDLNGDAYADYIYHTHRWETGDGPAEYLVNRIMVFINNQDGTFVQAGSIDRPKYVASAIGFFDHNYDGFVDILVEEGGLRTLFPSDGQGGFNAAYPCDLPDRIGQNWLKTRYFADVNGDGLTDLINYHYDYDDNSQKLRKRNFTTYLSNGNGGFELAGDQFFELFIPTGSIYDHLNYGRINIVHFKDVNNDNLADLILEVYHTKQELQYYLSDGNGQYILDRKIDISRINTGAHGAKRHIADLNADGWPDVVKTVYYEYIGDGTSPEEIDNSIDTYLSTETAPFDLMQEATSPSGAKMTFNYRRSSEVGNHCRLPFILHSVKELRVYDGVRTQPSLSTYLHHNGYYDATEREYRGFEVSSQVHPDGTVTKTHHYVGSEDCTGFAKDSYYLAGRIRQVENYASDGVTLLSKTFYTWDAVEDTTHPWAFVKLSSELTRYYDDQTVSTQKDYHYDDTNGNLKRLISSGTGANAIVTQYDYHNYSGDDWNPLWRQTLEMTYYSNSPVPPAAPDRHVEYVFDTTTGNLKQKIEVNHDPDMNNSIWEYDYYINGNLRYEYDANGNPPTEYVEYDNTQTYPIRIINPKGHESSKAWDRRYGKERSVTDPNQQTTYFEYEYFGRLEQTDYPDGGQTVTTYNDYCTNTDCTNVSLPRRIEVDVKNTDTTYEKTVFYYDGLSRKVQTVKNGENNFVVAKTHFDSMGRVQFEARPFFRNTTSFLAWNGYTREGYNPYPGFDHPYVFTDFDDRGRPVFIYSMDGQSGLTKTAYDYSGLSVTITDPDNCAKTETRDHLARIIEVIDHPDTGDIHTGYVYNSAGDLLEVRNHFWTLGEPDKHRIEMMYDSLGRKTRMDDPDMGQLDYEYDANGSMILQTDAKGNRIQFGYDELNRIELKDYLDTGETSVVYKYDEPSTANGIGRLHRISNQDVTTEYLAYDPMGRPVEMTKNITGAATRTTLWDYDYSGKVKRLTYPHTDASPIFHLDYAFHPGTSLVHTATGSDGTVFATFDDYAPSTKIGHISFGNNAYTDYTYDGWSERINAIKTHAATGAVAQDRVYTYSPAGDITEIDDLARVETYYYSYDKMHRLISETTSTGSVGVVPAIMEMRYDNPDHINAVSTVVHKGISHAYVYDENGNQESGPDLSDPMAVVTRNMTFNADDMPVSVAHPSGGTISLTYDGENKRAKKTGAGKDTYYFSNEFEIIDNIETFYIFAGNLRVAIVKNNAPAYFHKDHLGSSTAMTDAQGNIIETAMYMPFGGKRGEAGISVSDYKFTDQELDAESGLYNYDARLYDPILGRFITADDIVPEPFNSQSLDAYGYCFNNPLIYTDPSGHYATEGDAAEPDNSDQAGGDFGSPNDGLGSTESSYESIGTYVMDEVVVTAKAIMDDINNDIDGLDLGDGPASENPAFYSSEIPAKNIIRNVYKSSKNTAPNY